MKDHKCGVGPGKRTEKRLRAGRMFRQTDPGFERLVTSVCGKPGGPTSQDGQR